MAPHEGMSALATAATVGWLWAIASHVATSQPSIAPDVQSDDQSPVAPGPTSAVRGIVKKVSAKQLVITRSTARHPSDLTLLLIPSTLTTGTIAVGDQVSVRYRTEGKVLIATAVTVTTRKAPG